MNPQRVASGVGLVALAALLIGVGLPPLLPPSPVAAIEIVAPAGEQDESVRPTPTVAPGRPDDPDDGQPDDDADNADDDTDSPGGSPDDSPDDDEEDDDD